MEISSEQLKTKYKELLNEFNNLWLIEVSSYKPSDTDDVCGEYNYYFLYFDNEEEAKNKKNEINNKISDYAGYGYIAYERVDEDPILLTPDNIHDYMGVIIKELCS